MWTPKSPHNRRNYIPRTTRHMPTQNKFFNYSTGTAMTQTEAIRTISEYDGWEQDKEQPDLYKRKLGNGGKQWTNRPFDYHTNLNSLYPVAGLVVRELVQSFKDGGSHRILVHVGVIRSALCTFSPDLNPLLMAVADGITLLNSYK